MSGRAESKREVPKKQDETECVIPRKHWNDYSVDELRVYLLENRKETDCSFVVEDQQANKDASKVYESFKWILCDMSPVLKEILEDPINQAKNCKGIVVPNPKYIEAVLFYGQFKVVDADIIDLVDSYEASKQYQIPSLKDEVIEMCISEGIPENVNWVRLFWLSCKKYPEDQLSMRGVFKKVKGHVDDHDKIAGVNLHLILDLNEKLFDIFFGIMLSRVSKSKCFKITEAYLIKYFFDGDKEKSIENLRRIERELVQYYFDKLRLWELGFRDLKTYFSSKLLHKNNKIKILNKLRLTYLPNGYSTSHIDDYLTKLKAE